MINSEPRLLERTLVHVGMAHIAACEECLAKVSAVAGAHLAAVDRLEGHGGRFEGGDKGGARQQVDAPAVVARPCGRDRPPAASDPHGAVRCVLGAGCVLRAVCCVRSHVPMQAAAIAISAAMFTRSCNSCVGLAVGRAACCSSHTARVVGVQLQLQSSGSAARRRSLEEAARYVETFRAYEKRQADIIQHKVSRVCVCTYVRTTQGIVWCGHGIVRRAIRRAFHGCLLCPSHCCRSTLTWSPSGRTC